MTGRGKFILLAVAVVCAAVAAYYFLSRKEQTASLPASPAPTQTSNADAASLERIAKQREDLMDGFGDKSKTLAAAAKGAPLDAAAVKAAEEINAGLKQLPSLFPAGSDSSKIKTRAKPEIWANMAKFEAYAKEGEAEFAAVAAAAKAGDTAAYQAAFAKASAVCGACHKDFRGPRS